MKKEAVWITGVGTINPLGASYEKTAEALLAGKSGVRTVTEFPIAAYLPRIAGRIDPIPLPPTWPAEEFFRLDRMQQLLLWCAAQALESAGWWDRRTNFPMGLVLGMGAEWAVTWEEDINRGGNRVYQPDRKEENLLGFVQSRLGLTGPAINVGAACAGGNYALALGRRWVERGWVDICLAGAAELPVTPMAIAGFGNLRALSRRNDDPASASRPFDRGRDGMVLGEGGALFVLERASHARRRGACPRAELAGFGASSDAAHLVIPGSDPAPAVAAMTAALAEAAVPAHEINYINAHATSTPVGDCAETQVLKKALGEAVAGIPVSSTKSMTGHLLSGAAALNALACLVALERQAIPPTINLHDPDPACDLCHVPNQARPQTVGVAVSNSFGFGGANTTLVLRKAA